MTGLAEVDAADVAALDTIMNELIAAWNAGDADAYGAPFTDDAVYVTYFGAKLIGPKGVADGHRRVFAGQYRGSRLLNQQASYRFLRPDVVAAVQDGAVATVSGGAEFSNTLSYVFVKNDGEWRIASFHNARVSDPRG